MEFQAGDLAFLNGEGEMGERVRNFDWTKTPVGPISHWPQSLKIAVRILLGSRYAMWLGWGPDFTFFYNDAYAKMTLGPKHPSALGKPASEVWTEIWDDVGPRAESVIRTGQATWDESLLLFLEREGFPEETYHTFSYSPLPDDHGGIGGMLCVVTEDTERTINERRLRTLRELASSTTEETRSVEDAIETATRTLTGNPYDVPFALIYLLDDNGKAARLLGSTGLPAGSPVAPPTIDLTPGNDQAVWPLSAGPKSGDVQVVTQLEDRFGRLPGGIWPDATQQALVVPMAKPGQLTPTGFVVAGISPRLKLTESYRGFFDLLSRHVATAITNARAYEEERKRAEALAELDQAKTAFFSNVSHEFRTPLTLMLGPVEDLLTRNPTDLTPDVQSQLEIVNRNGLRLLRLVNSLLDFSRIEAGRVRAIYQSTDLAAFTADLASNFRSACERAGLQLIVDCQPLGEPVFVDREMWEKIVLNLVSNAFKFTFDGKITVSLKRVGSAVELQVGDTGTGIPADEMPRLFERFHRIEQAGGRTHEGSGIGLALVQELVKLHCGTIRAESVINEGTTFTITLPLGVAHLPAEQIVENRQTSLRGTAANPYVEEALRWLPHETVPVETRTVARPSSDATTSLSLREQKSPDNRPRVLIADDNADLRQYIARILEEHFQVEAVADGEAALRAARSRPPDLILTDIMMPQLDGFQLLQELRADPRTASLPVIMLSARAGEESRVEGMKAGADDYLVKPFSARELLVRVTAHLHMSRLRREANEAVRRSEERFRAFMSHSPAAACIKNEEGRFVFVNRLLEENFQRPAIEWLDKTDYDFFPLELAELYRQNDQKVLATRTTIQFIEPVLKEDGLHHFLSFKFPLQDGEGKWLLGAMSLDITEKRQAEEELRRSEERLRVTLASIGDAVITTDTEARIEFLNGVAESLTGWKNAEAAGKPLATVFNIVNETTRQEVENPAVRALRDGVVVGLANHTILIQKDGLECPIDDSAAPVRDAEGHVIGCVLVFRDVTERRRLEKETLEQAEAARKLAAIVDSSEDAILSKTVDGIIQSWNAAATRIFGYTVEEAIGKPVTILFPPDRLDEEVKIINRIRSGERVEHFDTVRLRKDGTAISVSLTVSPIKDREGRIVGASKIARDITERKQSEEALLQSERRLAAELEVTTRLHDLSSRLLSAGNLTEALQDILENAIQTCGANLGNIQLFNPDIQALEIAVQQGFEEEFLNYFGVVRMDKGSACAQAMQAGERILIEDVELDPLYEPHRDIAARAGFRAVVSVPLKAHDGAIVGMLSTHFRSPHRISKRDERLLDLYARHAADFIERMRLLDELRRVAAELSEANHRKDEFLATLAHELRNPLAPIRNALQILKVSNDPEFHAMSRTLIERQLSQMVRLVDDLMDVSRITRGKVDLRKETTSLAAILSNAVETSRPLIDEMGHTLIVNLPDHPVLINADSTRLSQVFANLLNNAAKYSDRESPIWLSAEVQGPEVVVRVKDQGIGIPSDKLISIFEMFSQVERSLDRSQGGLGIGLTLVKRLIEMHGGTVEAQSPGLGYGAEFIARLPVLVEGADRPADEHEDLPVSAAVHRILIIDDNRDGADSLAMMLRLMGHQTATAYDGQSGVDLAGQFRPDVILLDIGLPKLNGYETCRRIRQQAWSKATVIIAVTGWGQDEDRRRSQEAGFDHHLIKPIDPQALVKILANYT